MSCTHRTYSLAAIFGLVGLLAATGTVSAGLTNDVPDALNDVLFGGGNDFAAKAVLTACVLVSIGIFLAMMQLPKEATFIVLLGVIGALTAIGWADPTIILIAALIAVLAFTKRATEYFTGGGVSGEES